MAKKKVIATASQRQLRVGEQLRHSLSDFFLSEDFIGSDLEGISITVSEVRVSPDLKNSTAFVSALGGNEPAEFINILNEITAQIRHIIASNSNLKYTPKIIFKQDDSFARVDKINALFESVSQDSKPSDED